MTLELAEFVQSVGVTNAIGYAYNGVETPNLSGLDDTRPSDDVKDGLFFVDLVSDILSVE